MKKVENQEKKKKLLQQIGKYTTAAGAVLLTGNLANAEVHLTTTTINLTDGIHGIDFDGDGQDEVQISVDISTSDSSADASISRGSGASNLSVVWDGHFVPGHDHDAAAFPLGQIIGPTLQFGSSFWTNSSSGGDTLISTSDGSLDESSSADGNFGYYPNEIRYCGVKFDKGGQTYYGWIGIRCNSFSPSNPLYEQGSVGQVINFAYESTPNTSINAGGGSAVPVLPIASALGLGLAGLFGYIRNRRKKSIVE
jgi:hypothetical protein